MSDKVRNPEGIDFNKYPPPPGYVVVSEMDMRERHSIPIGWKYFFAGWQNASSKIYPGMLQRNWTYLRPKGSHE